MTDADTLALAYFRQEFRIQPQSARLLWALWSARGRLSVSDLVVRTDMSVGCLKVAMHKLRAVLDGDAIDPPPRTASAGHKREISFMLAPHAREEIARMMVSATQGLMSRIAA